MTDWMIELHSYLTDWLIDWLIGLLTEDWSMGNWTVDWLIDKSNTSLNIDWWIDRLANCLIVQLKNFLINYVRSFGIPT